MDPGYLGSKIRSNLGLKIGDLDLQAINHPRLLSATNRVLLILAHRNFTQRAKVKWVILIYGYIWIKFAIYGFTKHFGCRMNMWKMYNTLTHLWRSQQFLYQPPSEIHVPIAYWWILLTSKPFMRSFEFLLTVDWTSSWMNTGLSVCPSHY